MTNSGSVRLNVPSTVTKPFAVAAMIPGLAEPPVIQAAAARFGVQGIPTLLILKDGRVEQEGPPAEIYGRPASVFVGRFLGSPPMNVFPASLLDPGRASDD